MNFFRKIFSSRESSLCPCCETRFESFLPLPQDYVEKVVKSGFIFKIEDAETLNINQYLCPSCNSSDRDRLIVLYLRQLIKEYSIKRLLHIAPAKSISNFISTQSSIKEVTVDLYMEGVDYNVSLTDLSVFPNGHFDAIICSHVLEHIEDHEQAAKEIYRVAAPSSVSMMLVPVNKGLVADLKVKPDDDVQLRWMYYGQDDHVRLYSRNGFVNLLSGAGFKVELFKPNLKSLNLKCPLSTFGVDESSILYIARKR